MSNSLLHPFQSLFFFQGLGCCSDYSISFHYMSPSDMYLMDYLLYHLKPYGLVPQPGKVEHFKSDTWHLGNHFFWGGGGYDYMSFHLHNVSCYLCFCMVLSKKELIWRVWCVCINTVCTFCCFWIVHSKHDVSYANTIIKKNILVVVFLISDVYWFCETFL